MTPLPKGRPTFCSIDLEAVRWNFRQARKKVGPGVKILSVVKADAYGHGAMQVARVLEDEGSYGFGVATLEEGIELRKGGLQSPVLILAGIYPEQIDELLEYRLTPTVCEVEALRLLERLARKRGVSLPFHLKVDTGMGRLGFLPSEINSLISELAGIKALKLEGVFSNFSQAERADGDYTQGQVETFKNVVKGLKAQGHHPRLIHLANSAAVIALPSSYFTMVRPGLVLYGVYPSRDMARRLSLKPILTWKTHILQLKRVPKGAGISYGRTFVTKRESLIAILPVGYADGYHRLLSNRGSVLVRGKRAPIVGRICMDLTMIDVTDIRGVKQGDEVVLLGKQGADRISADEMARWAETISYEILTSISARVPRVHHSPKEE